MKILFSLFISISFIIISSNAFADSYGCRDIALDYAIEQAVLETEISNEDLRNVAKVEKVYLDDTYGTGEYKISFVTLVYNIDVIIYSDEYDAPVSCEVDEGSSYKNN